MVTKQSDFLLLAAKLIIWINRQGYQVTGGDLYRDPRSHGKYGKRGPYGRRHSTHKRRLAIDLNLFFDGVYLQTTEDHRRVGEYWESLDPRCRWGGWYQDGNHYSFEHNGRR